MMKPLNAFLTLTLLASSTIAYAGGFSSQNLLAERETEKALRIAHNRIYQLKEKGKLVGNPDAFEPEITELKNLLALKFGEGVYDQYLTAIRDKRPQIKTYLKTTFHSKSLAPDSNQKYEEAMRMRKQLVGKFDFHTASANELARRWTYHAIIEAQQKSSKKPFSVNFFPEIEFCEENLGYLRSLYANAVRNKKDFTTTLKRSSQSASVPVRLGEDYENKPTRSFSNVPGYLQERRLKADDRSHSNKVLQTVEKNQQDRIELTAAAIKVTDARLKKNLWIEALDITNEKKFTTAEQEQLNNLLDQFIPAFEYEQKVSHAPKEHIIISCENKKFTEIYALLQRVIDGNALLRSIVEKKEQEDEKARRRDATKQDQTQHVTFAYDNDRYVHLEQKATTKDLTAEVHKRGLSQAFLEAIHLQDGSSAQTTFPRETLVAREELTKLLTSPSGFVVLPTRKNSRQHSVVFKVTSNNYFYFDSALFPNDVEQYNSLRGNHTFVLMDSIFFAIPHAGPQEKIKSLSYKSALAPQQNSSLYELAHAVWANNQGERISDKFNLGLPYKQQGTLIGWAAPITLDVQSCTLSLSGWSGVQNEGPAEQVQVFYKSENLGTIRVDQPSHDVHACLRQESESKGQAFTADFTKTRFQGDISLREEDVRTFNENNLIVIGVSKTYEYNALNKTSVDKKGYIFNAAGQLTQDGLVIARNESVEGWAAPITVTISSKLLSISGWSAVRGWGASSRVLAFYKGLNIGFIPVDQISHDIVHHYQTVGQSGNYENARFSGTISLNHLNLQNFNPSDLAIIGLDHEGKYNFLQQALFERKE